MSFSHCYIHSDAKHYAAAIIVHEIVLYVSVFRLTRSIYYRVTDALRFLLQEQLFRPLQVVVWFLVTAHISYNNYKFSPLLALHMCSYGVCHFTRADLYIIIFKGFTSALLVSLTFPDTILGVLLIN